MRPYSLFCEDPYDHHLNVLRTFARPFFIQVLSLGTPSSNQRTTWSSQTSQHHGHQATTEKLLHPSSHQQYPARNPGPAIDHKAPLYSPYPKQLPFPHYSSSSANSHLSHQHLNTAAKQSQKPIPTTASSTP